MNHDDDEKLSSTINETRADGLFDHILGFCDGSHIDNGCTVIESCRRILGHRDVNAIDVETSAIGIGPKIEELVLCLVEALHAQQANREVARAHVRQFSLGKILLRLADAVHILQKD
jgi:hypothetical protein